MFGRGREFYFKNFKKAGLALLVSLFVLQSAFANPYSFGGACKTNGSWTNNVLLQSNSLSRIFESLKNDENCQPLVKAFNSYLGGVRAGMRGLPDTSVNDPTSLGKLVSDSKALFTGLAKGVLPPSVLANRAMDANVDKMSAMNASNVFQKVDTNKDGKIDGYGYLDLRARTYKAAETGLDLYISLMNEVANSSECITNKSEMAGQFFASSVMILSSFLSSGLDLGGVKVAEAISRFSSLLTKQHYAQAIAGLDMMEFQNSFRCLLEVSSETYCSILDNKELLKMGVRSLNLRVAEKPLLPPEVKNPKTPAQVAKIAGNPFTGIFVLGHHVPNITNYLQKVMLGADPNDQYDGMRKADIIEDVTRFQQSSFEIVAQLNRSINQIDSFPTVEAQRNSIFLMLQKIIDTMGKAAKAQNFFATYAPQVTWPFMLIGMPREAWPVEVITGNVNSSIRQDWNLWMEGRINNHPDLPMFKDPIVLLQVIKRNLSEMIDGANRVATRYYGRWFLADKTEIIDQIFIDQRFTVYQSLLAVDQYLYQLTQKIELFKGERVLTLSINDMRKRIRDTVDALKAYSELKNGGGQALGNSIPEVMYLATEALSKLYYNFNVLLSRTSFLANRLANYVRYDYKLMLENGLDLSDYQKNLLIVLGDSVVMESLRSFSEGSESIEHINADLENASNYASENLEAIEKIFIDRFAAQAAYFKLRYYNAEPTKMRVMLDSIQRLDQDSRWNSLRYKNGDGYWSKNFKDIGSAIDPSYWIGRAYRYMFHSERYPMDPYNSWNPFSFFQINENKSFDTSTGSAGYAWAQMCVQSLAFNNYQIFEYLCDGAVLQSAFDRILGTKKPDGITSFDYNQLFKKFDTQKDQTQTRQGQPNQQISFKREERVCAYRNYYRNNYVYQLSIGQHTKTENSIPAPVHIKGKTGEEVPSEINKPNTPPVGPLKIEGQVTPPMPPPPSDEAQRPPAPTKRP